MAAAACPPSCWVTLPACAAEPIVACDAIAVGESSEQAAMSHVAAVAEPTLAEPPASEPSSATTAAVPELKPVGEPAGDDVQQAVAIDAPRMRPEPAEEPVIEPAADKPAPLPEQQPAPAPAAPAPPAEPNLFEEAEKDLDESSAAEAASPLESEKDSTPVSGEPPQPEDEPVEEGRSGGSSVEPVNPLDAAAQRSGEQPRLWVDATGRHSVVGVLVAVRTDGTCVLDTGTGMLEVRSADLRRRDRDYAAQAAERLATRQIPAAIDTAAR